MDLVIDNAAACDHLRVEPGDDFDYIESIIPAAQARVEDFLDRSLIGEDGWEDAAAVPPNVIHAVKLALSDLYNNREAPQLTDDQLRPICGRYQVLSFG